MSTFIFETGYDVKQGEIGAFVSWLAANEDAMRAAMPDGLEYLGTFTVVQGSERTTGQFRTLMRGTGYGDLDTFAAAAGTGDLGRLMSEMIGHVDQDRAANGCQFTLKSATTTTYWGDGT